MHSYVPSSVIADQVVREVGARLLRHDAARVLRGVRPGERTVVTRYGEPQAVVFSVRDAMEMLATPRLFGLAATARADYLRGRVVVAWRTPGLVWILLARQAAEVYWGRLRQPARGRLRRTLMRGGADPSRALWLEDGRWLAAFSYPDDGVVLVHALIDGRELERQVVGEDVWRARLRRNLDRHAHARTPWQRAARADSG